MIGIWFSGVGKKKTSISKLIMKRGKGIIKINGVMGYKYFNNFNVFNYLIRPFESIFDSYFDIYIQVKGGGVISKINAICLSISKAILDYDYKYKDVLKKEGFLSCKNNKVERKKVGYVKSRKKKQFTKR